MKNPGLMVFAAPTDFVRSPNEVLDDLDFDEGHSDYVRPTTFNRWHSPGTPAKLPVRVPFKEFDGNILYGEIMGHEDEDSANKIIKGDHESHSHSENPYVERARQDLHTPESVVAINTLSGLLRGEHPNTMSPDAMAAAHRYLRRHFTGVRVNPHHGTMMTQSPAGAQVAKRKVHLPAVREDQPAPAPKYALTNKHGTFESHDPKRLVRAMVAFQIVHNELAQKKQSDDSQDDGSLKATSGWFSRTPSPLPPPMPHGSVFEPGKGTEKSPSGHVGGYVMPAASAPSNWWKHEGTAYSPGHHMRLMLDPAEAKKPRSDPRFAGHTFTYAPNSDTGHTAPRKLGRFNYYVQDNIHPAARGDGFDHVPRTRTPRPAPPPRAPRGSGAPAPEPASEPRGLPSGPKPKPRRAPKSEPAPSAIPDHDDQDVSLPPGSAPDYAHRPPRPEPVARPTYDPEGDAVTGPDGDKIYPWDSRHPNYEKFFPRHGSTKSNLNDLCPACDSGYLEPFDGEHHECLNCGSLIKQSASRPPLGRGLSDIPVPDGDPLDLASAVSGNSDDVIDLDATEEGSVHHPLFGERPDPDSLAYEAPRRLLGGIQHVAGDVDPLEQHLGKHGFFPIHKPGQQSQRAYVHEMPGLSGSYFRLTEGAANVNGQPTGWALTADNIPNREQWTKDDKPYRNQDVILDVNNKNHPGPPRARQRLRDLGDRAIPEVSFLATGAHPVDDDALNRAIKDVHHNGRNSETYRNAVLNTAYEAPQPVRPAPGKTQFDLRGLSSVSNPGLARFVS